MTEVRSIASTLLVAFSLLVAGAAPAARAQGEIEPNEPCNSAQLLGAVGRSSLSLDAELGAADVDFFRFSAEPGTLLLVNLQGESSGNGSLRDPFLGLFDGVCTPITANDDAVGLDSRLEFLVPADGSFVLAATGCCDSSFFGSHGHQGTYRLTVTPPPPSASSISGQIIDRVTRAPLRGDTQPFGFVELLRCEGQNCSQANSLSADSEGRFRFQSDSVGRPLFVGTYRIRASANEYESALSETFEVSEGQDFSAEPLALQPPAILFSQLQPCEPILPQGGTCRYTVHVQNNTRTRLSGLAWSLVDATSTGSAVGFASFEANAVRGDRLLSRRAISAPAFGSQQLQFQFDVPSFTPEGATFCTRIFLGLTPEPLVNTVRQGSLFCIAKSARGFQRLSDPESQRIFRSLGQPADPLNKTRTQPKFR